MLLKWSYVRLGLIYARLIIIDNLVSYLEGTRMKNVVNMPTYHFASLLHKVVGSRLFLGTSCHRTRQLSSKTERNLHVWDRIVSFILWTCCTDCRIAETLSILLDQVLSRYVSTFQEDMPVQLSIKFMWNVFKSNAKLLLVR